MLLQRVLANLAWAPLPLSSIEGNQMVAAHVGDSRIYLLHHGISVRHYHDHSYAR